MTADTSRRQSNRRGTVGSAYFNAGSADGSDSLNMLTCGSFVDGEPGSGLPGSQPFSVTVEPAVLAVLDFHAHLLSSEIIGFLGGEWDSARRRLHVKEAFPCRALAQETIHVELDPLAEVEVRAAIEERNMRVVGWYHSHPTFVPQPSMRDVQNQNNYQTLFIDQASNLMPFIGVIVSPFDARTPSPSSPITIFYVDRSGTSASSGTPKSCQFTCRKSGGSGASPPSVLGGGGDDEQDGGDRPPVALRATCRVLCALVHYYKKTRTRTMLQAAWRPRLPKTANARRRAELEAREAAPLGARAARQRLQPGGGRPRDDLGGRDDRGGVGTVN